MRLFVALVPSPAVREALYERIAPLRASHPRLRWVPRENLHLTLLFIGEGDPVTEALRVERVLAPESLLSGEFVITRTGRYQDRVLWAGVEVSPEVHRLAARLENPAFNPHMTLARAGRNGGLPRETVPLDLRDHWECIALLESVLTPDGAMYRTRRRWPPSPCHENKCSLC